MKTYKEKVKEKIKQYSNDEYLKGYIRNEYMTDDKDADIYLNLTKKEELFDSRTRGRQLDLNPEIYEYIESKTSMLESDIQIELHITGIKLSDYEQGVVRHLIKEHYAIELYKTQKEYKEIRNKICKLLFIGLLSFFLYIFVFFETESAFGVEVLGFLFSFALWEGFDAMIYSFKEIKDEREAVTQNLLINIEYGEKDFVNEKVE
jgi:hypothetical protein